MSMLENWMEEKRSAYLYEVIASYEKIPAHQIMFRDLANTANRQAGIWERELKKAHQPVPTEYFPDRRAKIVAKLVKLFGAKQLRFMLSAMKVRGMSIYSGQDVQSQAPAFHHENRHTSIGSGGNLRAAVFGINDGLISNMSLLLGVAGANAGHHFIVLSGIAGLLAGACSMAAGEYISVRSQREFFEYQIALERQELEEYPEEEALELAIIYEARGLSKEDARRLAEQLISQPETALDTLAREELGLNPNELGSPWGAAISSFLSFGIGAGVPLLPFLFGVSLWSLPLSILFTGLSLLGVGAVISLFTSRSAWRSGLRMLLIGAVAGLATYGIGMWIGA